MGTVRLARQPARAARTGVFSRQAVRRRSDL